VVQTCHVLPDQTILAAAPLATGTVPTVKLCAEVIHEPVDVSGLVGPSSELSRTEMPGLPIVPALVPP